MVQKLLRVNNGLLHVGLSTNEKFNAFVETGNVDAFEKPNWISLKDPDNLLYSLKHKVEYTINSLFLVSSTLNK